MIDALTTRLLAGDDQLHIALREQYNRASLRSVDFTGAGFFAHFDVPADSPVVVPARILGGNVQMTVEGMPNGAGSLLGVENGRLSFLEVYVYDKEPWTEDTVVRSYDQASPLPAVTASQ